jgi:hypothetical protein
MWYTPNKGEPAPACNGAGILPSQPTCYEGELDALGQKQQVKVTIQSFDPATGAGQLAMSGGGLVTITPECTGIAFTESGQDITVTNSDDWVTCGFPQGITLEGIKYCSDDKKLIGGIMSTYWADLPETACDGATTTVAKTTTPAVVTTTPAVVAPATTTTGMLTGTVFKCNFKVSKDCCSGLQEHGTWLNAILPGQVTACDVADQEYVDHGAVCAPLPTGTNIANFGTILKGFLSDHVAIADKMTGLGVLGGGAIAFLAVGLMVAVWRRARGHHTLPEAEQLVEVPVE